MPSATEPGMSAGRDATCERARAGVAAAVKAWMRHHGESVGRGVTIDDIERIAHDRGMTFAGVLEAAAVPLFTRRFE